MLEFTLVDDNREKAFAGVVSNTIMTAPSADQSLRFALQREFLKLYGVAVFGWFLITRVPDVFLGIRKA